jgi:hypothetical protein
VGVAQLDGEHPIGDHRRDLDPGAQGQGQLGAEVAVGRADLGVELADLELQGAVLFDDDRRKARVDGDGVAGGLVLGEEQGQGRASVRWVRGVNPGPPDRV